MRAALITVLFSSLLLAGCAEPRHWPIPQLSVPAGAPPAPIPSAMVPQGAQLKAGGSEIQEGPNVYSWMKGFNYAMGWDVLVKHIEESLNPLGYKPYKGGNFKVPDIPGVPAGSLLRGWISPDGKYLVGLINAGFIKSRNPSVVGEGDADYVLGIDQLKDLPAALQEKVNNGAD